MQTLVFLPGFDGTGELFARLLVELGATSPVRIARYAGERTFDEFVQTAEKELPERDAIVIAESFSGPIALELMVRHPSRVSKAVLCATFAVAPHRSLARLGGSLPATVLNARTVQRFALNAFCLNGVKDAGLMDEVLSVVASVPPGFIKRRLEVIASIDMRHLRGRISHPVLLLEAARDKLLSASAQRELRDLLPNRGVQRIDGPHLLLQSCPAACAAAIRRFVRDQPDVADEALQQ